MLFSGNLIVVRFEFSIIVVSDVGNPCGMKFLVVFGNSRLVRSVTPLRLITKSSLNKEYMEGYLWEKDKIQKARLSLLGKETLDLRIFIDRSVIEVFVNEKLALVQRIYPVMEESDQVILFSNGGNIHVPKLESWKLHPSNPY